MKLIKLFIIILVNVGLISNYGYLIRVHASNEIRIRINPAIMDISLIRNEKISKEIEISNLSNKKQTLSYTFNDFLPYGDEGKIDFFDFQVKESKFGLSKWIIFDEKNQIELEPGQASKILFSIDIPDNAQIGGYYAILLVKSTDENLYSEKNISIVGQGSCIILASVSRDIHYLAKINDFNIKNKIYYQIKPRIEFDYRVENFSDTHIKPLGEINLNGWFGQNYQINANDINARVLPKSIRKLSVIWQPKWAIGKFDANLNLTYGDNQKLFKQTTFWIIPVREIAILLIIIILVITGLFNRKHKKSYKKFDKFYKHLKLISEDKK